MAAPRSWRRRTALVGVSLLGTLLVLEGGLRCVDRQTRPGYPVGLFVADERCAFRLAPDFEGVSRSGEERIPVRTNALGLRGPEVGSKAPGTERILALGDSFCFGHGVSAEEAYPATLQRLLQAAGHPAEVLNAGVPGYGTVNEAALFESTFEELQPDTVVLSLYVGNDFRDNASADFGRLVARGGVLVTERPGAGGFLDTLRTEILPRSRLALLLYSGLGGETAGDVARGSGPCADLEWGASFGYAMLRVDRDPVAHRAFEATSAALERVTALCAARGVHLVLLLLPGPCQYSDLYWNKVLARCGLDARDFVRDRPQRELGAWAAARGVPVVDLLPLFRERMAAHPEALLFSDVHFNVAGHALAAGAVAEFLAGR